MPIGDTWRQVQGLKIVVLMTDAVVTAFTPCPSGPRWIRIVSR